VGEALRLRRRLTHDSPAVSAECPGAGAFHDCLDAAFSIDGDESGKPADADPEQAGAQWGSRTDQGNLGSGTGECQQAVNGAVDQGGGGDDQPGTPWDDIRRPFGWQVVRSGMAFQHLGSRQLDVQPGEAADDNGAPVARCIGQSVAVSEVNGVGVPVGVGRRNADRPLVGVGRACQCGQFGQRPTAIAPGLRRGCGSIDPAWRCGEADRVRPLDRSPVEADDDAAGRRVRYAIDQDIDQRFRGGSPVTGQRWLSRRLRLRAVRLRT
jgi:hypothetical protein